MSFTIRANTAGRGWMEIAGSTDLPRPVEETRASGQAKILSKDEAREVAQWIEEVGWELHEAPVFLEPLE